MVPSITGLVVVELDVTVSTVELVVVELTMDEKPGAAVGRVPSPIDASNPVTATAPADAATR
jgi:hypothetical protein